MILIIYCS